MAGAIGADRTEGEAHEFVAQAYTSALLRNKRGAWRDAEFFYGGR
jgi:hypothetical protein